MKVSSCGNLKMVSSNLATSVNPKDASVPALCHPTLGSNAEYLPQRSGTLTQTLALLSSLIPGTLDGLKFNYKEKTEKRILYRGHLRQLG